MDYGGVYVDKRVSSEENNGGNQQGNAKARCYRQPGWHNNRVL
jgi:hypothetical protein